MAISVLFVSYKMLFKGIKKREISMKMPNSTGS